MAIVYLGRDLRYDRVVAIKVMRPELTISLGGDRFLREIQTAARLSHPHILPLFDSGEADGVLWYVMPFVDGESLRSRIEREGKLSIDAAVRIATEIAGALAHAHTHGVVHRDIKPENILLAGGTAVLTDFGIATAASGSDKGRLTGTGLLVGSPAYMSPEQATGAVDHRTDVYALGCVLYEMLGGSPPFAGPTTIALLASHSNKAVTPLREVRGTVPLHLEAVVLRALAKNPDDRFQTAKELAMALARVPSAPDTAETPTVEARAVRRSLAILPFVDLSPARDQEYFCEGVTEELRSVLSKVEGLQVASRTSGGALGGRNLDVKAIGKELGVSHVLEGTVRSAGDRLRVSVTLTGTADGFQLWSERYDRTMDDVFEIQDDIARRVSAALRIHLTSNHAVGRGRPANLEAYRAYLRGRHHWNRRTERSLRQSVIHMEEAIAIDASYAQAWAGLADAWVTLGIYGADAPGETMPKALDAAKRALALDPTLAEALVVRGAVKALHQWQWKDAEADFQEANRLDPRYPTGHHWYATHLLMPTGRLEEAAREIGVALELDPSSPPFALTRGLLLALHGHNARAIDQFQQLLDRDPEFGIAHYFLGQVLEREQRFPEAVAALEQALIFGGESPEVIAMLGYTHARAGDVASADRLEARLAALAATRYVSPALLGLVRLGRGDLDGAMELLERAAEVRATELVWLKVRWFYDPLRRHAEIPGARRTGGAGLGRKDGQTDRWTVRHPERERGILSRSQSTAELRTGLRSVQDPSLALGMTIVFPSFRPCKVWIARETIYAKGGVSCVAVSSVRSS